ncbi:TPA: hypothetical protein DGT35_01030 [Patescibacteria group bacterium]|nr:hypothetical protein [Patescibacteria group bacterium]|tara:strand:- start:9945 stop:10127 length:183 start_codon:yes stop_codon:yes gene_type:complete
MGIFKELKNLSPERLKELQSQAQQGQKMIDDMIEKRVKQEIEERDLVSRDEVQKMIEDIK